ncbi:MAG: LamG domain-containing protein, partial [Bacteroidetes bacterium]
MFVQKIAYFLISSLLLCFPRGVQAQATAQGGYTLDFDGTEDYVQVDYNAALNPSNFTIEAWAKVEGGSGTFRSVITSRKGGNPSQGFMLYAASDNTWQFWTGDGGDGTWDNTLSGVTVVNEWTHIAASFDGTSVRLYINGELKATTASVYIPNAIQPLRIGAGATEGAPLFFFPGKIDEVRIWSSVRSLSEIQANMHKSLTGSESNLAAYYNMSNGNGTTLTDNSTNSYD